MNITAIHVDNISKVYRIQTQQQQQSYRGLRDAVTDIGAATWRALRRPNARNGLKIDHWALRDVSFDIGHGEAVGLIGRNGSGKSTLLKVLSRITEPTFGRARLRGRVGSLLEVGTGFHPELTGRENIYLSGALLGMTRVDIARKFDEIVAFSEVGKFIDTPVKRYSSGMYVRLAFGVAAHLEPEILLVDEVLAVGDAAFQKKCLGKMGSVAREGRTVVFVSHNLAAVQSLCDRSIWLSDGRVMADGSTGNVVSNYLQTTFAPLTEQVWADKTGAPGNDQVRLHRASVRPMDGSNADAIHMATPFTLEFDYWNMKPESHLNLSLHIYTEQGIIAFNTTTVQEPAWDSRPFPAGLFRSVCHIPADLLNEGVHSVELLVVRDRTAVSYRHEGVLVFEVRDKIESRGGWYGTRVGAVHPKLRWTTELIDANDPALRSANAARQPARMSDTERILALQ